MINPKKYAVLMLRSKLELEAGQERIIYAISSYMDAHGLIPCRRENAERTLCFTRTAGGWSVFDDCADRLDAAELDGLGRCLTRVLSQSWQDVPAIGIMGDGDTRMLRLYREGRRTDTYITSPGVFGCVGRWLSCRGHAVRWWGMLPDGGNISALSAAFELGQENAPNGFDAIQQVLHLDGTCRYGFSSLDEAKVCDEANCRYLAEMYFCAANHVRQRWFDKFLPPFIQRRTAQATSFRNCGK